MRKYPSSRPTLTSHGIVTPVPDILPPKGSSETEPKPRPAPKVDSPFYLQTGYATFAKRLSRPFPPPFVSVPSSSFSDPLTTHSAIRDRRPAVDGEFILGATNGDDAVFVTENYLVVNDGVGAWASKPRGHAALWSRLIGHFWGMEADKWIEGTLSNAKIRSSTDVPAEPESSSSPDPEPAATESASIRVEESSEAASLSNVHNELSKTETGNENDQMDKESVSDQTNIDDDATSDAASSSTHESENSTSATEITVNEDKRKSSAVDSAVELDSQPDFSHPNPIAFLQTAFEKTKSITKDANDILGTTTFVSAMLHFKQPDPDTESLEVQPVLYVTNVGDSTVLIIRPNHQEVLYRSKEQWHWFDCPRQLGTNSPDTPNANAVTDKVDVIEGDLVVAVSDGVADNLWEHEICEVVCDSLRSWKEHQTAKKEGKESKTSEQTHRGSSQKSSMNDHPVSEIEGDDEDGLVFVARELVRCARVIAEDSFAESPFMERAVDEGLPFEGGKMDDITVAVGKITRRPAIG